MTQATVSVKLKDFETILMGKRRDPYLDTNFDELLSFFLIIRHKRLR